MSDDNSLRSLQTRPAGVTLAWNSIRPLNGGRDKGFEELCAQLARAESPSGSRFIRKGTPDAGVECYAILSDSSEWGWQAKHIFDLGSSQWSQIDDSVKTALQKHPKLVRYFVCVPIDRPDARMQGRKSAKDRWDEHERKWSGWASDRGMTVEFVYWGSSELVDRLTQSQHAGRLRFWFDAPGFDGAWFSTRLNQALQTAGPRYTPELHVNLPIAWDFETFGRTDRFFDREKARARMLRAKLREFQHTVFEIEDSQVKSVGATISSSVQAVLDALGVINTQPTGPLPFNAVSERLLAAETTITEQSRLLADRGGETDVTPDGTDTTTANHASRRRRLREVQSQLFTLTSALQDVREAVAHADKVSGSGVMILRGDAGVGKTHLLCDVAQNRVSASRPTVLLMGQQFLSNDAPWFQALQQLDLTRLSADEFIGALEAAAQAADSRALLMIDAINEGAGRRIWPSHLPAFLSQVARSSWIGVVLAVRSSYEESIIPAEVRSRATTVDHLGFLEHEYDATKTFFVHYGLELPSTPLLAPEFRNPLFLKTLCHGLNAKGQRRLPRGFHGVTAIFDMYLSAVNEQLASNLGFDRRRSLVQKALQAISEEFVDSGKRWLSLSRATDLVDAFLPGREFEKSLYRDLVAEGLLIEDAVRPHSMDTEESVFIAYERFADHLVAKNLIDRYLDDHDPTAAFAPGSSLSFVCDSQKYVSPGLLEALCILIPERTGQELVDIAPACVDRMGLSDAFRKSIMWRAQDAFSDGTLQMVNKSCRSRHDLYDTLDVLLTVATLPDHPLNALFLNQRLRADTMPDRDAWWSVYLHHAWGGQGAVDRLVDWAWSVAPGDSVDDDVLDLCAIALAWMFTTSNRFLRDRATKALVSLLAGRLQATVRLVKRFADVDDSYVAERVYAVAYGVAMRCHDPELVGALATCVYARIFTTGSPPAHILLRDYARGVVERAIHLGAAIDVVEELIRPPYKSTWPTIPTEDDIKPLLPGWSSGSHDSNDVEWARSHIAMSVMDDDFARYVIGTNGEATASDWLSPRMDDEPWKPPAHPDQRLRLLVGTFSDGEREAYEHFQAANKAYIAALTPSIANWLAQRKQEDTAGTIDISEEEALAQEIERARPPGLSELEVSRSGAVAALEAVLTEEHAQQLNEILEAKNSDYEARQPPRFDLSQIQRYVLWRVFDLGWTIERFGRFDRFAVRDHGRDASKAERIGKKYQWIAYYEIMALISDHFQYRENLREEDGDQAYEGPWQSHLRNIDPSCSLRSLRGGTSWDGHVPAWWGPARYDSWESSSEVRDWVLNYRDVPKVEGLLIARNPSDDSHWINGDGYFDWKQQAPADQEKHEIERRELWYICTGYLIRADDSQDFLSWAEGVDFWGRWMPEAAEVHRMFLGEHAWAPASHYFEDAFYGDDGWAQARHNCPVKIRPIARRYMTETGGFDCSIDESYSLRLPASELITGLGVRWSGNGADFLDPIGRRAVQDPTVHAEGPSGLLVRADLLHAFLTRENLTVCWAVLGEKRVLSPSLGTGPHHPSIRMTGAFILSGDEPTGFVKYTLVDPNVHDPSVRTRVIDIVRR